VRKDRVDQTGKVSLRYLSRLYKVGLGRAHKGRQVKLLIADQSVGVIDLEGQLIRELTLDPDRIYQPLVRDSAYLLCPETSVSDVPTHNKMPGVGFEPTCPFAGHRF
jgi:hypothetical protein